MPCRQGYVCRYPRGDPGMESKRRVRPRRAPTDPFDRFILSEGCDRSILPWVTSSGIVGAARKHPMSVRANLDITISYDDDAPAPSRTETGLVAAVIHNRHAHLLLERDMRTTANGALAIGSLAGVEEADYLSQRLALATDEDIMRELHTFVAECFPHLTIKIEVLV